MTIILDPKALRDAEIDDFDLVVMNAEIIRLDISMDNASFMHSLQGL